MIKLDISRAWDGAMRRLSANKEIAFLLAGVFFFLPQLGYALLTDPIFDPAMLEAETVEPEELIEAFATYANKYWWALALLSLVQAVGVTAILSSLGAADRPTVGDAMQRGVRLTPSQFAAELLTWSAIFAPFALVSLLASIAAPAALLSIPAIVLCIYIAAKVSLAPAVIAIENRANPLTAIRQSWALTKHNSGRLVAFYALIVVAFLILSSVFSLVAGIVLALASEALAMIGDAIIGSLFGAAFATVFLAIRAAIMAQLSGGSATPSVPRSGT